MIELLLFAAVCFLAFSNGANDNFKGVASLYGSGATSYRTALIWSTVTTLAGSLFALFLAQTLLVKFSGKGLAPDYLVQSIPFITAVAAGAGFTVILATRLGFPVSTTHALLGALTGSTLLATGAVNFGALGKSFVYPLLLSPVISIFLAQFIYSVFKSIDRQKAIGGQLCLCVENPTLASSIESSGHAQALVMEQTLPASVSIDSQTACAARDAGVIFGVTTGKLTDGLHFLSAGAVCFARGLNDTPKIAALLLLTDGFGMEAKIGLIAGVMAIGGLVNSRRIAETMSRKITTVSHGQGLSANLATALLVIVASKLGMPVSTTHVSVGALFGIGLAGKTANVRMIASILLSWLLTLPCAALCAACSYALISRFAG